MGASLRGEASRSNLIDLIDAFNDGKGAEAFADLHPNKVDPKRWQSCKNKSTKATQFTVCIPRWAAGTLTANMKALKDSPPELSPWEKSVKFILNNLWSFILVAALSLKFARGLSQLRRPRVTPLQTAPPGADNCGL